MTTQQSVHKQRTINTKSSAVAEMGDRWVTISMGRKWRGAAVGAGSRTLSPHLTMWPGPRPTSLPSGIIIHPTIWPQLPTANFLLVGICLPSYGLFLSLA